MYWLKKNKKILAIILLLVLFSIPSVFSLLRPGFFQSDDGEWMIVRFSAFYQAFRDGEFPVRFLTRLNHGYGYPVANFLYPGFMYLGVPIHLLGFGFVNTIKIVLGLSMVGSLVFTYLWLRKIFSNFSAIVGSLFGLYAPYHLFNFYKRGSVGELLALASVPFILWMIEKKSLFFISLGIFSLIISHNILALLLIPVLFIYSIFKLNIKFTLVSFTLGIFMSSFFTIPAITELTYTNFSSTKVSDIGNYFADINLIGISSFFVLFLIAAIFFKIQIKKEKNFTLFFLLAILGILLSSKVSQPIWNFLPSSFIQFPFRLLSYLVISLPFLVAFIISRFLGFKKYFLSLVLVLILIFSASPFIKPSEFFDKGDSFYATNEGTTTVQDEYMPKWVKQKPKEHFKEKVEVLNGKVFVSNLIYNSNKIQFSTNSKEDLKIRISTIYYPGWKAYVDGKESVIQYGNDKGIMELLVPKGKHKVKLFFSETPIRLFADTLSALSLISLLVLLGFKKCRN